MASKRLDGAFEALSYPRPLAQCATRTDFYTFIDTAGELNASYEQMWGHIETAANSILREHLENPFVSPTPFNPVEKYAIDAFVALQSIRSPANRRVMELVADYGTKLVNQDSFSADDMDDLEFRPHQNQHLEDPGARPSPDRGALRVSCSIPGHS